MVPRVSRSIGLRCVLLDCVRCRYGYLIAGKPASQPNVGALASVTVLPVTSELRAAPLLRIALEPDSDNGLRMKSQIMVDKIQTVPRDKAGTTIGTLHEDKLVALDRALAVFLGIA